MPTEQEIIKGELKFMNFKVFCSFRRTENFSRFNKLKVVAKLKSAPIAANFIKIPSRNNETFRDEQIVSTKKLPR